MLTGLREPHCIEKQIAEAAEMCSVALAAPKFAEVAGALPQAPTDAQGWFELIRSYPNAQASIDAVKRMHAAWPEEARLAGASFGHYAILQALTVAAPRVLAVPVPNSVKRLYASMCAEIAQPTKQWQSHFDINGGRFQDLAQLASLRRFPAGEMAFDFVPALPRSAPLRIRPLALPGFVRYVALDLGGIGPVLSPHLNYARSNTLILQKTEAERSWWRMAKTLEQNPHLKGFVAVSWLYSAPVGELFPNLAWLRNTFVDAGAYIVDMEPSRAGGWGFTYNSARRRQLYDEGKFCPRDSLVLWRRDGMMAWACSRPELADEDEAPLTPPKKLVRRLRAAPAKPARAAKHNSPIMLWDGRNYCHSKPVSYTFSVILLPALTAALAVALTTVWWAGVPAFVAAIMVTWSFQYYFLQ